MPSSTHKSVRRQAGFSMVEVLMSTMVLAIGLIMLFPAFSVGLVQTSRSIDQAVAMQLGPNAAACCRAMFNREDINLSAATGTIQAYQFGTGTSGYAISGRTFWRPNINKTNTYANKTIQNVKPADETDWICMAKIGTNRCGAKSPCETHPSGGRAPMWERINPRIYGDPLTSRYYWGMVYKVSQPGLADVWIFVCKRTNTDQANPARNPPIELVDPTYASTANMQVGTCGLTGDGRIFRLEHEDQRASLPPQLWLALSDGSNACIDIFHCRVAY